MREYTEPYKVYNNEDMETIFLYKNIIFPETF